MLEKIAKYIGFRVHRRPYLIWSSVTVTAVPHYFHVCFVSKKSGAVPKGPIIQVYVHSNKQGISYRRNIYHMHAVWSSIRSCATPLPRHVPKGNIVTQYMLPTWDQITPVLRAIEVLVARTAGKYELQPNPPSH